MPESTIKRKPLPPPTRREAVRFSIASTRLAGQKVIPEMEMLLDRWAEGGVTDDELMQQTADLATAMT